MRIVIFVTRHLVTPIEFYATMSSSKTQRNKTGAPSGKDVESFWKNFTDDVSIQSTAKEILIGASTGWFTGFMSGKIGKAAALGVGSAIILLKFAHHKGYIDINWSKVNRNLDKIVDKIEENVTGREQNWSEKVERYVDRKLDAAEDKLKNKQSKFKRWYSKVFGDQQCKLHDSHIFIIAFATGVAIGVKTTI